MQTLKEKKIEKNQKQTKNSFNLFFFSHSFFQIGLKIDRFQHIFGIFFFFSDFQLYNQSKLISFFLYQKWSMTALKSQLKSKDSIL